MTMLVILLKLVNNNTVLELLLQARIVNYIFMSKSLEQDS